MSHDDLENDFAGESLFDGILDKMLVPEPEKSTAPGSDPQIAVLILRQAPYAGVEQPVRLIEGFEFCAVENSEAAITAGPDFSIVRG